MLSFSRNFLKLVFGITALAQVHHFAFFVVALVAVRYLGAELFGVHQYFLSLAMLPIVFCSHFPIGVSRFIPTTGDTRKQADILLASVLLQLVAVAAVVLCAVCVFYWFPATRFWTSAPIGADETLWILVGLAVLSPVVVLQSTLLAFVTGLQRITASQIISLAVTTLHLVLVFTVSLVVSDATWGLVLIIGARAFSHTVGIGVAAGYMGTFSSVWRELSETSIFRWPAICREIFKEFTRDYTLPLQTASIFSFLKEHLAIIVLGQAGALAQVAYFDIVNKIYDPARKLIPQLVRTFMPRIVVEMDRGGEQFRKQFKQLTWIQLGFNVVVGFVLIAFDRIILALFDIELNQTLQWLFILFAVNLLLASIGLAASYPYDFSRDTTNLMRVSLLRSAVIVALTLALVPPYGPVGGAVALVISSTVNAILLGSFTANRELWSLKDAVQHALVSAVVVGLWLVLFVPR